MKDTEQWFTDKLEKFKDDPEYLKEKKLLEEGELKDQLIKMINANTYDVSQGEFADKIIILFKREGWKSPEEVKKMMDIILGK